jgi:hypothetical protein
MELTIAGLLLIGVWCVAAVRGLSAATFVTLLTVPLGAAAAINIPASGLSILVLQAFVAMTTGLAALYLLASGRGQSMSIPAEAWVLGALCLYGVVSAYALPRLFYHEVLVVPYQRAIEGVRLSEQFYTTLIPLEPTSSNISQPGYLLSSFTFFLVMVFVARMKGADFVSRALLAAGLLNVILGVMDMLRLDALLNFVRTADYAIVSEWSILGADRLIGGFPEPSAFGSVCAVFAAYGLSLFIDRYDWFAGFVGFSNAVFAVLALSSTGWFGLFVAGCFLFGRTLVGLTFGTGKRAAILFVFILPAVVFVALFLVLTPFGQYAYEMLDRMILSKPESNSGLERGVWASEGYRVFQETIGFGAGLGSVRSNGILPVILSNVGLPGLLLSVSFVWLAFFRSRALRHVRSPASSPGRTLSRASLAGAVACVAMMSTTAVLVDPGILFFALAAVSTSVQAETREPAAYRTAKAQVA